ncbi:glycosyltransferase [Planomonospora sp. ID82291]|uniref:glycosyltransferase n=1 Tax=Planomonospora sp. ID82291 TaxID=2738136 RepID=UPI0018C3F107|nr:glycosyltransferase [Planomonospora sp. ID82291]MBG0815618.1 glycosyltransferase [Planomonospora sp. ID82291]
MEGKQSGEVIDEAVTRPMRRTASTAVAPSVPSEAVDPSEPGSGPGGEESAGAPGARTRDGGSGPGRSDERAEPGEHDAPGEPGRSGGPGEETAPETAVDGTAPGTTADDTGGTTAEETGPGTTADDTGGTTAEETGPGTTADDTGGTTAVDGTAPGTTADRTAGGDRTDGSGDGIAAETIVVVPIGRSGVGDSAPTVAWRVPTPKVPAAREEPEPEKAPPEREEVPPGETVVPSLSVVVVAGAAQSRFRLAVTVKALRAQDPAPEEIVLVVDRSPELADWAEAELGGAGGITVVREQEAAGAASARNLGLARVRGDVVAFLDGDSAPEPGWSAALLESYADPDVAAVRGRVALRWSSGRPDWFPAELAWVLGVPFTGSRIRPDRVDDLYGGALSFRREALAEAGGFPEEPDHRPEEVATEPSGGVKTELRSRLLDLRPGAKLLHEPSAVVRLDVPERRSRLAYFMARCAAEGRSQADVTRRTNGWEGLMAHLAPVRNGLPRAVFRAVTFTGPADIKGWKALLVMLLGMAAANVGYVGGRLRTTRADGTPRETGRWTWFLSRTALPVATVLWGLSLREVHLDGMTDLGLITVLPALFWIAVAVMIIGFVALLGDRRALELWHAGYTLVLIAVLHATPALLYPSLRYSWAWKHVSVIDYLIRHGATDPELSPLAAYHQWPGFFSFFAMMTEAAGLPDTLGIAAWGPAVFNTAMLLPLLLLFRTVTRNRQLVWGAVWVYFSCSWVGQDYFSPQATTLVLYLTVLVVVVRRFRRGPIRAGDDPERLGAEPPPVSGTRRRLVWTLLLALPIVAIASSHQLTPLMLVAGLAALFVLRRHRNLGILLFTGSAVLIWDAVAAWQLLEARFSDIVESLGDAGGNLDDGFLSLGTAAPGQVIVAYADRALSAGLWLLAAGGAFLRRRWLRRPGLPLLVIGLSPLLFLAAGSYGGEIMFRIYLFALPLSAFLAAALFLPARRAFVRVLILPLVLMLMVTGFFFGNYGKEQANYFTQDEVRLVRAVHRVAPEGSLIVAPTFFLPAAYDYYERYQHSWLDELPRSRAAAPGMPKYVPTRVELVQNPVPSLVGLMSSVPPGGRAYLVLNRAQKAAIETAGIFPKGTVDRLRRGVEASGRFRVLLRNSGGAVYELIPKSTAGTP